jgi:hypothetical protein
MTVIFNIISFEKSMLLKSISTTVKVLAPNFTLIYLPLFQTPDGIEQMLPEFYDTGKSNKHKL